MRSYRVSLTGLFLAAGPAAAKGATCGTKSVSLELEPYYNNKAFGQFPSEAAFDRLNQSYQDPGFPTKTYTSSLTGIKYFFPGYTGPDVPDNVVCDGQVISVPETGEKYFSASFLLANDRELASVSENVTFTFSDNTTQPGDHFPQPLHQ